MNSEERIEQLEEAVRKLEQQLKDLREVIQPILNVWPTVTQKLAV